MTQFRWGVFGTGAVSAKFIAGLTAARDAEVGFVASRSLERARSFAAGVGVQRAVGGYAEAADLGGVDAIYIATPPSEHLAHALLCIKAGIPVLVEKPLAATASEAHQLVEAARVAGVFAMEGLWTRFLPALTAMREHVTAGTVGEVRVVAGNFGTSQTPDPSASMFNPVLGGGALAHLGPYPLSLSQWMFGTPELVEAAGRIGGTGVDEDVVMHLRYPTGILASFYLTIRGWAPDDFHVAGSNGLLALTGSIVRPHGLLVSQEAPRAAEQVDLGWRMRLRQSGLVHQVAQRTGRSSRHSGTRHHHRYGGNGYHYEADEVRACVERGDVESAVMPLSDSLAVAATLERVREAVHTSNKEIG